MKLTPQETLSRLATAYRQGGRLLLLFDYDGTLVPIAEHPRLARLEGRCGRVLQALASMPRVRLGIISGRSLEDLRDMVRLAGLYFAGNAGLEVDLRGRRTVRPANDGAEGLLVRLIRRCRTLLSAYPGAWVEDKRLGFTIHYRSLQAGHIPRLLQGIREALGLPNASLRVLEGPMAVEVTPELRRNKGTAVLAVLEDAGPCGTTVFYAGDAANDADAFRAVGSLGGITLAVGADAPDPADSFLPDPAALADFLCQLKDALQEHAPRDGDVGRQTLALHGLWRPMLPSSPL